MQGIIVALGLAFLVSAGCGRQTKNETTTDHADKGDSSTTTSPSSDPQQRALAARDDLFKRLSTKLMEAMGRGGPTSAIEICSREAPRLAEKVGKDHGVRIGRTSFKLRNPKNSPPSWAADLIPERPEEPRFVELPDGTLGALLPIKLKAQCVTCHGPENEIADEVKQQLQKFYPHDQATGFREGDLRGWFWVEVPEAVKSSQRQIDRALLLTNQ